MPPAMRRPERQDIADLELVQTSAKGLVFTVERVGDDGTEGPAVSNGSLDQVEGKLGFGAKGRIRLATSKPVSRGVGFNVKRVVDALVSPERRDRASTIVGLAEIGQILATNVSPFGTIFAIAGLIDDQHASAIRGACRLSAQQVQ